MHSFAVSIDSFSTTISTAVSIGVRSVPTKDELVERVDRLVVKVDQEVERLKHSTPDQGKILQNERVKLGLMVLNLQWAKDSTDLAKQLSELNTLANKVEEQLSQLERGETIAPIETSTPRVTGKHSTETPPHWTVTIDTSTQSSGLTCGADSHFFDRLFNVVSKMNAKINELTQQHKGDEALVLLDKVHQVIDWQKQLETLVKQVNAIVQNVEKVEKSVHA